MLVDFVYPDILLKCLLLNLAFAISEIAARDVVPNILWTEISTKSTSNTVTIYYGDKDLVGLN